MNVLQNSLTSPNQTNLQIGANLACLLSCKLIPSLVWGRGRWCAWAHLKTHRRYQDNVSWCFQLEPRSWELASPSFSLRSSFALNLWVQLLERNMKSWRLQAQMASCTSACRIYGSNLSSGWRNWSLQLSTCWRFPLLVQPRTPASLKNGTENLDGVSQGELKAKALGLRVSGWGREKWTTLASCFGIWLILPPNKITTQSWTLQGAKC